MATQIKPFKGVIYNQGKINDLSRIICPPYDIISPADQARYHALDPHNFIHILLGKDTAGEDKYQRSAAYFEDWLKNKILTQDTEPAIYFYNQQYNIKGEKKFRLGFIALLRLGESVFAHEHTRLEAKEDRLKLLRQVKANLSPIFVVFSDQKRIIQRTYEQHLLNKEPFIDIIDEEKCAHKIWRLNSPDMLARIQADMQAENIFIADGHHRYEVACLYRDQLRQGAVKLSPDSSFNYILAYFTNSQSRGLTILPIHRLVKSASLAPINGLVTGLKEYFDLEEIKDKTRFLFLLQKAGSTEHVIGMYKEKKFWLLRLKNIKILDKMISDKPPEYRCLDVSILNYIVLKKILGLDPEDKHSIIFNQDADDAIRQLDCGACDIAFLLNPVRIQQIISVALNGEKMPPKSTYFYPKVASGLVINKLED